MSETKICMVGAAGRMGRRIIALTDEDNDAVNSSALEYDGCSFLGMDSGEVAAGQKNNVNISTDFQDAAEFSDVFIDFTGAEPTMANLDKYRKAGKPLVIGSTGLTLEQQNKLKELSTDIPILFSPNMSLGVNLTFKVLEMVSKAIGETYDIEIVESHHRMKKDAPSGTAVKMAEVIADTLGRDLEEVGVYCRKGIIGERTDKEIGIQTIRAGDIVGEHTVMFCAQGERIEITHRAHTRDTFAKGAISAAKWLKDKPNGFYNMYDVLGL